MRVDDVLVLTNVAAAPEIGKVSAKMGFRRSCDGEVMDKEWILHLRYNVRGAALLPSLRLRLTNPSVHQLVDCVTLPGAHTWRGSISLIVLRVANWEMLARMLERLDDSWESGDVEDSLVDGFCTWLQSSWLFGILINHFVVLCFILSHELLVACQFHDGFTILRLPACYAHHEHLLRICI